MKNIKSLALLLCLSLVSGMAHAVNMAFKNATDTTLEVVLSGGSHNEPNFENRQLLPGATWSGKRDCTKAIAVRPSTSVGARIQPYWGIELTDQVCHRDWTVTLKGNTQTGFFFSWDKFQND